MGLEQMSLPRYPPVAAPPTLRSRPPTSGSFLPRPPVSLHPLVTEDRLSVERSLYPSDAEFLTGGRGVYTQRSVAKGRTRGREGTPVARDRDTGRAGSMGTRTHPAPPPPTRPIEMGLEVYKPLVCLEQYEVPGSNPGPGLGPKLETANGCVFNSNLFLFLSFASRCVTRTQR